MQRFTFSYKIENRDTERMYRVDLSIQTNLEGAIVDYPIFKNILMPIPVCSGNFTKLPGDGTVGGFLEMLGENNVGHTAVHAVLSYLDLEVCNSCRSA